MSQTEMVSIAGFPKALRWHGLPQHWEVSQEKNLTITAGPRTDWFVDPGGKINVMNAPALLMETDASCRLSALITVDAAATFDAGVLVVYQNERLWAKLCLELSPQKQLMVVSVVTKETSDDCNSVPVSGNSAFMRLAKMDRAYAFHYSLNGRVWNLIRHFSLGGDQAVEIGFLAQSPTGDGCTATYQEVFYLPHGPSDIRSGE